MRLTVQTDLALRMLTYLAFHRDRLVTVSEIAARYQVSHNHLTKVANALGHLGAVQSERARLNTIMRWWSVFPAERTSAS